MHTVCGSSCDFCTTRCDKACISPGACADLFISVVARLAVAKMHAHLSRYCGLQCWHLCATRVQPQTAAHSCKRHWWTACMPHNDITTRHNNCSSKGCSTACEPECCLLRPKQLLSKPKMTAIQPSKDATLQRRYHAPGTDSGNSHGHLTTTAGFCRLPRGLLLPLPSLLLCVLSVS